MVAAGGVAAFGEFADRWLAMLRETLEQAPGSAIDLVPHNLVVDDDGRPYPIDHEFDGWPLPFEQIVRRGIYQLAVRVTPLAPPERWAPAQTVGEVMIALGRLVGLAGDGSWVEQFLDEEIALRAAVDPTPLDAEQWHTATREWLQTTLARRLENQALGERTYDRIATVRKNLGEARRRADRLQRELDQAREQLERARRLTESPEARVAARLVRAGEAPCRPGRGAAPRPGGWRASAARQAPDGSGRRRSRRYSDRCSPVPASQ